MILHTPIWQLALPDSAAALAMAPDGRRLAVATLAGDVVLVDLVTGKLGPSGAKHQGGALAVAWSPSGDALATAGQDGRVYLVGSDCGVAPVYRTFGRGWIEHLAWSPDGECLAIAAGRVAHVVAKTGETVLEAPVKSTIAALAWFSRTPTLAVAGYGGVHILSLSKNKPPVDLAWPGALLSLAVSPYDRYVTAGCQEGAVQLWTGPTSDSVEISGFDTKVRHVAWNPSGTLLAAAGGQYIPLWAFTEKGPTSRKPSILQGHKASITGLTFLGDETLASIDEGGHFITWSRQKRAWSSDGECACDVQLIGLAATNSYAAVAGSDASLLIFALNTGARGKTAA
jgi:WD40 repeat protein